MKPLTQATKDLLSPLSFPSRDRLELELNDDGTKYIASFFSWNGTERSRTFTNKIGDLVARIPERQQLKGTYVDQWEFAATDFTTAVLAHVWPREQLMLNDEASMVFDYHMAQSIVQDNAADVLARWKEYKEVPKHNFEMHPDLTLELYQQVALYLAMQSTGYALFMEQGTGKTPVSIARVCNEVARFKALGNTRMYRTLIVAPNNVRMNWQSEFMRFSTRTGVCAVLRGDDMTRTNTFIETLCKKNVEHCVMIVSYETLTRMWSRLRSIEWDMGILDEGHYIKWPDTQRAKTAMLMREVCTKRMLLTGTPITNTALDLYSQLEFLEKGASGFMNWKAFRTFYGKFRQDDDGNDILCGMQNTAFMQERLAKLSFIITKQEALPWLPQKVQSVIEVEMTPPQKDAYNELRDSLALEIESDLADDSRPKSLVVQNVLTKLLRLAQITSGFVKWDAVHEVDGTVLHAAEIEQFTPNPKIDALVEAVREMPQDEKMIVWCCFVNDIKAISKRFEEEGIEHVLYYGATKEADREASVSAFNGRRSCRVFVGNAAAGGTGLNLLGYPPGREDEYETDATETIYYSQNWSPTQRWQSGDRNHRRGTRRQVRERDLCVPGTIDEEIRTRVMQKRTVAMAVSDIREILKNVLRGIIE